MKTVKISKLLGVILASSVCLYSNELNVVVDYGLKNHPVVKERLSNYEKTVYDLKISKSEYLPTLDYTGRFGYEKTLDQIGTNGKVGYNTYQNSLILTQNLFNGLKSKHRIEYEEARVMAAAYNYVEQTNDVAYNIVRNYINLLKFSELYELEKENVSLTREIFNKTKELTDSGLETISNLKKVDSSLQLSEFNLITQNNNLVDAQYNLFRNTGIKLNYSEIKEPAFDYDLPKTENEALQHALKYNPSIIVSQYNAQTAKKNINSSRGNFSPEIDLELAYRFDKNTGGDAGHERSYSAMFVVRHNFYNGNADYNALKKSKLTLMQENELIRDIRRQVKESLQLSWSAYTNVEKQILFLNSYLAASKETLELFKVEFEAGTRTLIDLLSAQDDYISARNKFITAKYDYLLSKYRILDAMGELVNTIFNKEIADKDFYKPLFVENNNIIEAKTYDYSDIDNDKILDIQDICDSTYPDDLVNNDGCSKNSKILN